MRTYDVIIVGGGISGCLAAALLAKHDKKVIVFEKGNSLGGRAMTYSHEGFRLNLGAHLLEDPGSGLAAMMKYLGKPIEEGPLNDALPVWRHDKWYHVNELYRADKKELKRIIKEIVESDFSDFDRYDNVPLRRWLLERTKSQGIVDLFEFIAMLEVITDKWYDHSAGDNLYVRKMHYKERHTAGFSHIPRGGFQIIFENLGKVFQELKVTVEFGSNVTHILVEGEVVKGVELEVEPKLAPTDLPSTEVIEASVVICTLPVWNVLDLIDPQVLPSWYVEQIRYMAQEDNKTCWMGFYAGSSEPIYALSERELTAWSAAPRSGLAGFGYNLTALDPTCAPEGKYLFVCGGIASARQLRSKRWFATARRDFEKDMEEMFPRLRGALWKRWHVVLEPAYTILGKPGLAGGSRPDNKAPNIEGLYFAGDTYKSRGIGMDRAARSALTCVEMILDRRLEGLDKTWRY